jgi:predicted tellurium resistance membrane protein TerC
MEIFGLSTEIIAALLTLTVLEIVLGVDNIIFISILSSKLRPDQQGPARFIGLGLAMISRIALLSAIVWVMGLTAPLFSAFGHTISGRDLILIVGGLFLVAKSTREIHERIQEVGGPADKPRPHPSFASVLVQIMLLDIVFSLDSVITAVGMANELWIMVTAVVIAVLVMMAFSGWISKFIDQNPAIKVLALSFLLLIGMVLIADGFGQHISKGYVYSAMAFSIFVEMLNMKMATRPVVPVATEPKNTRTIAHKK